MGQDTYRDSAFAGFSLGVTMVTYSVSLPTYLPACLEHTNYTPWKPCYRFCTWTHRCCSCLEKPGTHLILFHSRAWKSKVVAVFNVATAGVNNHTHLPFFFFFSPAWAIHAPTCRLFVIFWSWEEEFDCDINKRTLLVIDKRWWREESARNRAEFHRATRQ